MRDQLIKWFKKKRGVFPVNYTNCIISADCSFAASDNISLGEWIYIGPKCFLEAKGGIELEDGVVISSRVTILSSSHDYRNSKTMPYGSHDIKKAVLLKKAVWVGYGATIMPGVTVNEGAVIGAGAVVTKNVPSGCIVGGNPAVIIGKRPGDKWEKSISEQCYRIKEKLVG